MDVLSNILGLFNLKASVYFHSSFCGNWEIGGKVDYRATYHLIARGNCWLHMPDLDRTVALRGGDLIVFPRDIPHSISSSSSPKTPAQESADIPVPDGPSTSLICGYFDFESPQTNPILDAMPDFIHIKNESPGRTSMLDSILRYITVETESVQVGSEVIVDKLSEVLFIHVVRAYMQQEDVHHGLLAALVDKKLGRSLKAVHEDPSFRWSVANLAEKAGMSRSAFAQHFLDITGITPMQYVTSWRMQTAFEKLRSGTEPVALIAEQSGYQTEASFRKAFKQHMNISPGRIRKQHLTK